MAVLLKRRIQETMKFKGFRTDLEDYFKLWVFKFLTHKQKSPFMVFDGNVVRTVWHVQKVLEYPDLTNVLQAWVGKWHTDIFYFRVDQLKEYYERTQTTDILMAGYERS